MNPYQVDVDWVGGSGLKAVQEVIVLSALVIVFTFLMVALMFQVFKQRQRNRWMRQKSEIDRRHEDSATSWDDVMKIMQRDDFNDEIDPALDPRIWEQWGSYRDDDDLRPHSLG